MAELSQNTGLFRGFFKNDKVKSVLKEEREKADEGKMAQIKREVREKSLEKQVEIYQNEWKRLLEENERLKKEAVYSVYHVKIQLNIATQYTKHRKKCECSKWEIYNDWQGEGVLHMPVFY